jgi:hypothetical protein
MKKLTTEEFIEKARKVHGGVYRYADTVYVNSRSAVLVECVKHGMFTVSANSHLSGRGCATCGKSKKHTLSTSEFIRKAVSVHGERYKYNSVEYKGSNAKLLIVCPVHGEFLQRAGAHLAGRGCNKCGTILSSDKRRLSADKFVDMAQYRHQNKYRYDNVHYVTYKTPVQINCPVHGNFMQSPDTHLRGSGCPKCATDKTRAERICSTSDFVLKAEYVHGDRYCYTGVQYNGAHEKVAIICGTHGEFSQKPNNHLNGQGCPKCATVISKGHAEVGAFLESILNA